MAAESLCYDCGPGTYSNGTTCLFCPAGKTSSTAATSCSECPRGKAANSGDPQCASCDPGTYAVAGSENCTLCDGGSFSISQAFQCTACRPGTVSAPGSPGCSPCGDGQIPNAAQDMCVDCPAGKKRDAAKDLSCVACGVGEFSSNASWTCTPCSFGTYSLADKSGCGLCPAGKFAPRSSGSCNLCAAGSIPDMYQEACVECYDGEYALAGNATCTLCEPGKYNVRFGQSECTDCPVGKYVNFFGAYFASDCMDCVGETTASAGSTNASDCIVPDSNQVFECVAGKPCTISNFTGIGLVEKHSVMAKEEWCGGQVGGGGSPGPFLNGSLPFARRLYGYSDAPVSGFGSDGRSGRGSTNYTWAGTLSANPGNYTLCWCGGLSKTCSDGTAYLFDVGVIWVAGPLSGQEFFCVKGQYCENKGPISGVGFTAEDQIWVRDGCTIDFARASGVQASVPAQVQALVGGNGELDLYASMGFIAEVPVGYYKACWCSSKGENCSSMDLSPSATSSLYLEYEAATMVIEGPGTTAEVECFVAQPCLVDLPTTEGWSVNLKGGDRLSVLEQCGQGSLLRGLPGVGIAETFDGYSFQFNQESDTSIYLESDPGYFRLCWCRPNNETNIPCNTSAEFNVAAGLFIATAPYSGQSYQCHIGAGTPGCLGGGSPGIRNVEPQHLRRLRRPQKTRTCSDSFCERNVGKAFRSFRPLEGSSCIFTSSDFRGVNLASGDVVLPLTTCGGSSLTAAFPRFQPVRSTVNGSGYYYHLGDLTDDVLPERVEVGEKNLAERRAAIAF